MYKEWWLDTLWRTWYVEGWGIGAKMTPSLQLNKYLIVSPAETGHFDVWNRREKRLVQAIERDDEVLPQLPTYVGRSGRYFVCGIKSIHYSVI
jgi:hypothetical protein